MKKFISALLTMVMMLSMVAVPAMANKGITVTLDGEEIVFDVQPQLINDRTMVPLRAIFEALDAEVYWTQETQTVTSNKGNTVISMSINNPVMYVNGQSITLDTPPCIVDERTLVPVRAISEAFDLDVDWEQATQTVVITTKAPVATPTPTVAPTPIPTVTPSYTPSYTNSAFDILKGDIIYKGKLSSSGNYNIVIPEDELFIMLSYDVEDDSINFSTSSNDDGYDIFNMIQIDRDDSEIWAAISMEETYNEYKAFYDYNNGRWKLTSSTFHSSLNSSLYELLMSDVELFDTVMSLYSSVTLADFGITY